MPWSSSGSWRYVLLQETGISNLRVLERPVEGFRQDFCFAVKEGDRDTLALLNEGLSIVMADGTYRQLHAKWFAALQLPTDRPIVIGGDYDYPPFEYLDDKGRPAGFTVDLTRAIARRMDMDVRIRLGPWTKVIEGLERGNIDAIQGIFYSPERDRTLDFSPTYLVSHYVSVVRHGALVPLESVADLTHLKLVVQAGDVIHDFLVKEGLGNQVSVVETQEDVLRAVSEGQYDCGFALRMSALNLIKKNGWKNLALGSRSFLAGEYCYAVPGGQSALLAQLSEGLKAVQESGEYSRIYKKWLGGYKEMPPSLLNALRYSATVVIPLILVLLGILFWWWTLRRQVAEKTRELRESEEFQRAMIDCSPVALYSIDLEGKVLAWNASAEKVFGWSAEEVLGKPLPIVPQDKQEEFSFLRKRIVKEGKIAGVEVVRQRRDGTLFDGSLSAGLIHNAQGEAIGILSSMEDITQRKLAEAALKERDDRFKKLSQHVPGMIYQFMRRPDGTYCLPFSTGAIQDVFGCSPEEVREDLSPILRVVFPEDLDRLIGSIESSAEEMTTWECEYRVQIPGSEIKWLHGESSPEKLADGNILWHGFNTDITERKRAEAEEEKLRAQFIQAQKMESVGRLAGGVAHDFNNKLTVILGYAELAMEDLDRGHPIREKLQQVMKAGEQSVQIVSQLLAFARKQTIVAKVLDLNETIEGMLKMLRRLIGEDIDLAWEPGRHLWSVKMDPSQIDQILANLCVNARDAISGVGKVTIETENVTLGESYCADRAGFVPGDYVMLGVSDNGCGMDKETLANAFEPFFTTKEVGKGTGLGLSTVYGIVKQNNGFVNIYSEPGKGSTFKIYLPRHSETIEKTVEAVETETPQGRGETILIVEDDAPVLGLARRTLENLGYGVLTSANPVEAIAVARDHDGEIHLLLTDVVLPEMSGKDLGVEISKIRPAIQILYMSGYTANVIAHQGVLDEGVHFIGKPFTPDSLARKVREAMESKK